MKQFKKKKEPLGRVGTLKLAISIIVFMHLMAFGINYVLGGQRILLFNKEWLDITIMMFALIGGLYGYVIGLIYFLLIFFSKLFIDGSNAYMMAVYLVAIYVVSMFAQYRWYRTVWKTIWATIIGNTLISAISIACEMIQRRTLELLTGEALLSHSVSVAFGMTMTSLVLFLFFNFAPDSVKSIFPLGVGYTRAYIRNLLLQSTLRKTRLSIKITSIIVAVAALLGGFAGVFANYLLPDIRIMLSMQSGAVPQLPDTMMRARDLGLFMNAYGIAFNIKMFMMLLCVGLPVAALTNYYAKMYIGAPIGELSSFMMSFNDTTDENRMDYVHTIKELKIDTHDEIAELYRSIETTVTEVTEYIEDIKEEARLREELRVAQAASDAKSGFLSNMSHEIRTPINAVLGMDEMILRESAEPEIRRYAADIKSAAATLLSLVNDVLDFSKIEAGKMDILPVQYHLSSTVNDLVNMIRDRAAAKGLELNIHVDETIPDLLYGDEIRIKQCITNILTNAVKYTEKGSVTMTIGAARTQDDSGDIMLRVSVKDTGIGIKEEDLGKLFSPFERIEEIRNRSIEGTGLGMSIVKKLLALMDTRLVVNSVYGEGSDFSFEVRQKVIDPEPIGDFESRYREMTQAMGQYHESFRAPGAEILVVDDTRINLTVIRGLLKQTLVRIDTAESGRETLQLVCEKKYDVIFLDHRMPEMDGLETRQAMEELPGNLNTDTPCIALTANAVSGAREEYLAAGFADYLSKPVDPDKLERMLIQYLPPEKVLHESDDDPHSAAPEDDPVKKDVPEEFNRFTGIDVTAALTATGSPEVLREVLKDFHDSIPDKSAAIERYASDGAYKDYTIQVHALKSSARIIGAAHLSDLAAMLEEAGNRAQEGDTAAADLIAQRTPELLTLYRSYTEHLSAVSEAEDAGDRPEISADDLGQALSDMRELAEAYDITNVEQILHMLDGYSIPEAERSRMEEVRRAVRAMDRDRLLEALNR